MWERGRDEFSRVIAFSDGIFAIAMTLLVTGIAVPTVDDVRSASNLADGIGDESDAITSFFISFAVIGRYWVAHHAFFSLLDKLNRKLLTINLIYLGFIAFLPFPTALLGDYFNNPLTIAIYAGSVAMVSGMEVLLFRAAYRDGLLTRQMPRDVYRWNSMMSLSPVIFFVLSIPAAYLLGSGWAVATWFLAVPFQMLASRWEPEDADEYLLG